jgi:hypothetical protein
MAHDVPAGGRQRRGAGVGGEVMLGRKATHVADLTQQLGGQHRTDPKLITRSQEQRRAGVGPGVIRVAEITTIDGSFHLLVGCWSGADRTRARGSEASDEAHAVRAGAALPSPYRQVEAAR